MRASKILINCSNLHVGGGIQVAASLLYEFAKSDEISNTVTVLLSDEVNDSLHKCDVKTDRFFDYHVTNIYGFRYFKGIIKRLVDNQTLVFTTFGPLYKFRPRYFSVVGFAQAWIIYPKSECYKMLSFFQRVKSKIKFKLQSFYFKRADALIVELDHVKNGLIKELKIDPNKIYVIKNCISSIYFDPRLWENLNINNTSTCLKLGFVGRNYSHKNTKIFPQIIRCLKEKYKIDAKFFVTFTDEEWKLTDPAFRDACVNVGSISVTQCPSFYTAMDAIVFPSLLECFSATPLEAMVMQRPLFVSDRNFNRDICSHHAHYFDPFDPCAAAELIAIHCVNSTPDALSLESAKLHAINFSSPEIRAKSIYTILNKFVQ